MNVCRRGEGRETGLARGRLGKPRGRFGPGKATSPGSGRRRLRLPGAVGGAREGKVEEEEVTGVDEEEIVEEDKDLAGVEREDEDLVGTEREAEDLADAEDEAEYLADAEDDDEDLADADDDDEDLAGTDEENEDFGAEREDGGDGGTFCLCPPVLDASVRGLGERFLDADGVVDAFTGFDDDESVEASLEGDSSKSFTQMKYQRNIPRSLQNSPIHGARG